MAAYPLFPAPLSSTNQQKSDGVLIAAPRKGFVEALLAAGLFLAQPESNARKQVHMTARIAMAFTVQVSLSV
jgi:hypothetical protein